MGEFISKFDGKVCYVIAYSITYLITSISRLTDNVLNIDTI